MNKKEFIEKLIDIRGCDAKPRSWARGWDDAIDNVIRIAEELDEPKKPVIPKFMIKRGPEAAGISVEELNRITNAKAHGYDEVPTITDKTEPVYTDKDGAEITVGEITSISFEDAMSLVENKVETDANKDMVNEPNHYKGKHGIETIDVIRNFGNDDMAAGFYWGNAIKYMTRYRNKNGLEDLKKARRNLDWLIEHTEAIE